MILMEDKEEKEKEEEEEKKIRGGKLEGKIPRCVINEVEQILGTKKETRFVI
jgi:hypothetical protein